MSKKIGILTGISLALLAYKGYKVYTDYQLKPIDNDPLLPETNQKTVPNGSKTQNLKAWQQWAKELKGPEDWWKLCFEAGYSKEISHVLVVLRQKKDLGYTRKNLVAQYDDNGRTQYLSWAVRRFKELGLKPTSLADFYKKAFNQDLKVQYQSIYSKVVPLVSIPTSKEIWDSTKDVKGLIGLM